MWHKKEERTPEVHREYLKKLEKVKTPEDARALHKEMKKYKGGSGLPLPMRYPDAPLYISSTVRELTTQSDRGANVLLQPIPGT